MQKIRKTSTSSVIFLYVPKANKIVKRVWKKKLAMIGRKSRMSFAYALNKKILVFYSYLISILAATDSPTFRICKNEERGPICRNLESHRVNVSQVCSPINSLDVCRTYIPNPSCARFQNLNDRSYTTNLNLNKIGLFSI